jgi:hypothetical protein
MIIGSPPLSKLLHNQTMSSIVEINCWSNQCWREWGRMFWCSSLRGLGKRESICTLFLLKSLFIAVFTSFIFKSGSVDLGIWYGRCVAVREVVFLGKNATDHSFTACTHTENPLLAINVCACAVSPQNIKMLTFLTQTGTILKTAQF